MIKNEKIIKRLEGESRHDIERDMLESFGFVWITNIGQHADGDLLISSGLDGDLVQGELWIDWVNKRICVYKEGYDLTLVEGELNEEENNLWFE